MEYFYDGLNGWKNNKCNIDYKIKEFDIKTKKEIQKNAVGSCRFNNQNCIDFVTPKTCSKMTKNNNFIFSNKPCMEKICLPVSLKSY